MVNTYAPFSAADSPPYGSLPHPPSSHSRKRMRTLNGWIPIAIPSRSYVTDGINTCDIVSPNGVLSNASCVPPSYGRSEVIPRRSRRCAGGLKNPHNGNIISDIVDTSANNEIVPLLLPSTDSNDCVINFHSQCDDDHVLDNRSRALSLSRQVPLAIAIGLPVGDPTPITNLCRALPKPTRFPPSYNPFFPHPVYLSRTIHSSRSSMHDRTQSVRQQQRRPLLSSTRTEECHFHQTTDTASIVSEPLCLLLPEEAIHAVACLNDPRLKCNPTLKCNPDILEVPPIIEPLSAVSSLLVPHSVSNGSPTPLTAHPTCPYFSDGFSIESPAYPNVTSLTPVALTISDSDKVLQKPSLVEHGIAPQLRLQHPHLQKHESRTPRKANSKFKQSLNSTFCISPIPRTNFKNEIHSTEIHKISNREIDLSNEMTLCLDETVSLKHDSSGIPHRQSQTEKSKSDAIELPAFLPFYQDTANTGPVNMEYDRGTDKVDVAKPLFHETSSSLFHQEFHLIAENPSLSFSDPSPPNGNPMLLLLSSDQSSRNRVERLRSIFNHEQILIYRKSLRSRFCYVNEEHLSSGATIPVDGIDDPAVAMYSYKKRNGIYETV